ncbi:MAG: adenylate kinase family protein [Candidatus Methanomethylophilaceae archaeon]|nr:adenylate kinase family protein [Candidatus Methanomethylophilaceae archaeon]MDY0223839.1 adenylate kinase family protein [Candidatus Methanomethylophilaceae archaeon]
MPVIALTGTPGTGKTSASEELKRRGYVVVDINKHLRDHDLLGEKDEKRDTFNVDIDSLNISLEGYRQKDETVFLDSHLSHCVDSHTIIVFRCHPDVLAKRLEARGYNEGKVKENVQAEILDVILCEAMESDIPVYEVDCSSGSVLDAVDSVVDIINGKVDGYLPGKTNWTDEVEKWF